MKLDSLPKLFPFMLPAVVLLIGIVAANRSATQSQTQATAPPPAVFIVKPLLHPCRVNYLNCSHQEPTLTDIPSHVKTIGYAFDLNPKVLVVLARILDLDLTDQTTITQIAQDLLATAKNLEINPPIFLNHPKISSILRFDTAAATDYLLVNYLLNHATPETLLTTLSPPQPNDGQILGFVETYFSLFNENPLDP